VGREVTRLFVDLPCHPLAEKFYLEISKQFSHYFLATTFPRGGGGVTKDDHFLSQKSFPNSFFTTIWVVAAFRQMGVSHTVSQSMLVSLGEDFSPGFYHNCGTWQGEAFVQEGVPPTVFPS
jgi:hypothetical protein